MSTKTDAPRRVRRKAWRGIPAHPPGRIPFSGRFRWFRSFLTPPPANIYCPSGTFRTRELFQFLVTKFHLVTRMRAKFHFGGVRLRLKHGFGETCAPKFRDCVKTPSPRNKLRNMHAAQPFLAKKNLVAVNSVRCVFFAKLACPSFHTVSQLGSESKSFIGPWRHFDHFGISSNRRKRKHGESDRPR